MSPRKNQGSASKSRSQESYISFQCCVEFANVDNFNQFLHPNNRFRINDAVMRYL